VAQSKVAFLGLGSMGAPMAAILARADVELAVWNRTPRPNAVPGARVADTVEDACRGADVVITMLADDAAVAAVALGEKGVVACLARGGMHIGMSTVSVALARRLVDAHAAAGHSFVAAPVFGRPDAAAARKLWIVPGGTAADLARAEPLFAAMGQGTFPMPDPPRAALAKLLGNFLILATIESVGEALTLAEKAGLDPAQLLAMLTGTLFGSPVVQRYGQILAETTFEPAGFKMPLGLKDANLAIQAGEEFRVPMPVANLARERLLTALAQGREGWDWSGFASVIRESAGLAPRRK
jgi:3-hydroxyisobutyrate dehydrogenase-like beta-hydroxyacid dehydrogenase